MTNMKQVNKLKKPEFTSSELQIILKRSGDFSLARNSAKKKLNSVAFSPQANYTDRATAAYRRS
jgi:hypothetical protein